MRKLSNLLQKCVFFALFAALLCQSAFADVAFPPVYVILGIPILIVAVIFIAAALVIRLVVGKGRNNKDD